MSELLAPGALAATENLAKKKQLLVVYGQPDKYSTSFQTRQFTTALKPWFDIVPARVRNSKHSLLRSAYRVFGNSVKPFFARSKADYILYGNDGVANIDHWNGLKLIYWYDAPWNWLESPPARRQHVHWLRYRNLQAADHVFAVSKTQVKIARALRPGREDSVTYMPVGVNCTIFDPEVAFPDLARQRFGLPAKTIVGYLGYLGTVNNRVAGQPLLEMAQRLLKLTDVHFFVVGFGPGLSMWKEIIENLGIASHFTFSGFIPDEMVPQCIAAMDVCIDTLEVGFHSEARSETKLKQYMAMGRACVATAIGENCVDLEGGKCGVLVEPGSDHLLEGVLGLCREPDRRIRLGTAARRRAVTTYDWDVLAKSFVGALEPL